MCHTDVTAASVGAAFALSLLQKDTGSAMAKHSGAHLDLSAFSSAEVRLWCTCIHVHVLYFITYTCTCTCSACVCVYIIIYILTVYTFYMCTSYELALYTSTSPSLQELMSLGLDRLKSALMALGLKCGGYIQSCTCIILYYTLYTYNDYMYMYMYIGLAHVHVYTRTRTATTSTTVYIAVTYMCSWFTKRDPNIYVACTATHRQSTEYMCCYTCYACIRMHMCTIELHVRSKA